MNPAALDFEVYAVDGGESPELLREILRLKNDVVNTICFRTRHDLLQHPGATACRYAAPHTIIGSNPEYPWAVAQVAARISAPVAVSASTTLAEFGLAIVVTLPLIAGCSGFSIRHVCRP
jgi:hypothetical protein